MQLNISGHHVELTPALKDYVSEKFEKLERHFDHISNCQVTLEVEKVRQRAEATLHVIGGEIHAKAENEDMYAAIDETIDKIARRMRKHKTRLMKKKRPHRNDSIRHLEERYFSPEIIDHPEESEQDPEPFIVHPEKYRLRTMYKEDAVMELELNDRPFVLYKSARRGCLTIIYRRKDGEYGAIDIKE